MNSKKLIIIVSFLLLSCSPEFKRAKRIERAKDRIERLVKKYPEVATVQKDTIVKEIINIDTLVTEKIDTLYENLFFHDTVYQVKEGKATTKVIVSRDTIRIGLTVEPDTLIIKDTIKVECPTINITVDTFPNFFVRFLSWLQKAFGVAGILLIILLIIGGIWKVAKTYLRL